jgi:hypothetical protein
MKFIIHIAEASVRGGTHSLLLLKLISIHFLRIKAELRASEESKFMLQKTRITRLLLAKKRVAIEYGTTFTSESTIHYLLLQVFY